MTTYPQAHNIRIGTLVGAGMASAEYIRQILPHGFESFSLTFGNNLQGIDLPKLADEINAVLEGTNAIISTVGVYGNLLEDDEEATLALQGWQSLIENAHLFGTNIVTGFTGRLRDQSIPDCIPRFKEVFSPLVEQADKKDILLAFENCDMGGDWNRGDWNIAHCPEAWELMFDAIPTSRLGLQWEPCHQMVSLIDPLPQLRQWVHKIFHMHGKCCTIKWDIVKQYGIHGSKRFAFHRTPGFGDCNWSDIVTELREFGFTGSIDIEGWHDPVYREELEMTGQVRALHYLKQCRGEDFVPNPTT